MGQPLDNILKTDLIGSKNQEQVFYESINADGFSGFADASRTEQGFTVTIDYANGLAADVTFVMEVSTDGITFAPNLETEVNIVDSSGTIILDVSTSNVDYVRVAWTVASGTMDIYSRFSGKRRH